MLRRGGEALQTTKWLFCKQLGRIGISSFSVSCSFDFRSPIPAPGNPTELSNELVTPSAHDWDLESKQGHDIDEIHPKGCRCRSHGGDRRDDRGQRPGGFIARGFIARAFIA